MREVVRLVEALRPAEVDLWPRFFPEEPRGLRVEASLDGENWRKVAEAKDYWRYCSWAENRPLPNLDGWVVDRFEPIRCRWIRLTDVGERRAYYWAIDELKVRAPARRIPHVSEPRRRSRPMCSPTPCWPPGGREP